MSAKVLVVEDEVAIAESVAYALRKDGYAVSLAHDLASAERQATAHDLVVLDLMLPDGSGFDLLDRLRDSGDRVAVIVLSSRDAEADRVAALETGADDYVTKPFSPREVVARVRAVLRRTEQLSAPRRRGAPAPISVDRERRRALAAGAELDLTRVEFDLLAVLRTSPGRVFTRAQLIDEVWGPGFAISDRTVDSHVKAMRRKLGEAGADPELIETVRGVGYRLREGAPADEAR